MPFIFDQKGKIFMLWLLVVGVGKGWEPTRQIENRAETRIVSVER